MDMDVADEMYFINIGPGVDNLNEETASLKIEYKAWIEQQEATRPKRGHPVSNEKEYILWKERQGRLGLL